MTESAADEEDALNNKRHPHRLIMKGRAETHTDISNIKFCNLLKDDKVVTVTKEKSEQANTKVGKP